MADPGERLSASFGCRISDLHRLRSVTLLSTLWKLFSVILSWLLFDGIRGHWFATGFGMARGIAPGKTQRQVAALPFQRTADGAVSVLLVSSRSTHRPLIPKGWRMKGKSDRKAAAIEAMEEAGVIGKASKAPIGRYRYWKRLDDCFALVDVDVYSLEVSETLDDWPERGQRQLMWMSREDAVLTVDEPGLASILQSFCA